MERRRKERIMDNRKEVGSVKVEGEEGRNGRQERRERGREEWKGRRRVNRETEGRRDEER